MSEGRHRRRLLCAASRRSQVCGAQRARLRTRTVRSWVSSQVFHDYHARCRAIAGFAEPVLIESQDAAECAAVARYLHDTSGRTGRFQITSATHDPEQLATLFAACQNRTLWLPTTWIRSASEPRERLLTEIKKRSGSLSSSPPLRQTTPCVNASAPSLRLATLREHRLDLPLLVHYFTLQYNLRAGAHAYLTQAEVDDLMTTQYSESMERFKTYRIRTPECEASEFGTHSGDGFAPGFDAAGGTRRYVQSAPQSFNTHLEVAAQNSRRRVRDCRGSGLNHATLRISRRYGLGGDR